jgi:tripartite-type tricarboxylate transporter receptor subunit TctC
MNSRIMVLLTLAIAAGSASAQLSQWSPTRPIRMLLAYPPGAANDTNARAVAAKMTDNLKQQVIVDNRPGANGIVATTTLVRSTPDGHTLMAIDVAHAANAALYDKIPYDTLKDFEAISLVARLPMILLVHPASAVRCIWWRSCSKKPPASTWCRLPTKAAHRR